jgi:hypothetical protein
MPWESGIRVMMIGKTVKEGKSPSSRDCLKKSVHKSTRDCFKMGSCCVYMQMTVGG